MYGKGEGIKQDYAQAMNWYRKAIEKDNAVAMNNIGVLYFDGKGVTQDYIEAAKWYEKAADKGYPQALYNLGLMYWSN